MPEKWYAHWLSQDLPVSPEEASGALFVTLSDEKPKNRVEAILNRERKKAAFGNLTLVHYGVNRSLQHGPFDKKREVLFKEPNLHLNRCSRTSGIKTTSMTVGASCLKLPSGFGRDQVEYGTSCLRCDLVRRLRRGRPPV